MSNGSIIWWKEVNLDEVEADFFWLTTTRDDFENASNDNIVLSTSNMSLENYIYGIIVL